ncbi:MAG: class I SAM-dependent methyltransferase [Lentimicrobium sp.]
MEHNQISAPENCLICDNKAFTTVLNVKDYFLTGEEFAIYKCSECGLLITRPMPELAKLGAYYASEKYLSHSNEQKDLLSKVYHFVRNYTHKRKYKLLKKHSSGNSVLDIGCATGEFLHYCSSHGMQTTGVEPNDKARFIAQSRLRLEVATEPEIDGLESDSFDFITMWHVLEHVPDLNRRMKDIYRLLKDDGFAFIALPNHASYDASHYYRFWAAWDVPRHLFHFDRKSLTALASKHGFKVVSALPMLFDSYYVSLLSEKYMKGKSSYVKAFLRGFISNSKARTGTGEYSSLIYVLRKI